MVKVVLVTGAARGIGKVIANDLCRDHELAITWRSTPPEDISEDTLAIRADLLSGAAAQDVVDKVMKRFSRIDAIVNNAGLVPTSPEQAADRDFSRKTFDLNVLAPEALLKAALPHLESGASIVNISSLNAFLPPDGGAVYGASKAALNLWTRGMAKELGPRGIRVNAVAPGVIDLSDAPRPASVIEKVINETALRRIGRPEDIARAVRFFVEPASEFITGEVLTVAGGYQL